MREGLGGDYEGAPGIGWVGVNGRASGEVVPRRSEAELVLFLWEQVGRRGVYGYTDAHASFIDLSIYQSIWS